MSRPPNETEVTPSGIRIEYWAPVGTDGKPQQRRYTVDSERAVNVTTLSNLLSKGDALIHWSHKLRDEGKDWKEERDRRAIEGSKAHEGILQFLKDTTVPEKPDGYAKAYLGWYLAVTPEPLDAERMVASAEYGFAGRFDLLAEFTGRKGRIDFKTSGAKPKTRKDGSLLPPYDEHLLQLELYEVAALESGYPGSDFRAVVRLYEDGTFDQCESWANPGDALLLSDLHTMKRELNERGRAIRQAA